MRRGTIYRRCAKCGRKVPKKTCPGCGYDRFSWAYVIDTGHVGGKRRQQSKSGFTTKAEANAALATVQASVAQGVHVERSKLTVAEFLLHQWLPAIEATIRPTTLRSYRLHVARHINPHIGVTDFSSSLVPISTLSTRRCSPRVARMAMGGFRQPPCGAFTPRFIEHSEMPCAGAGSCATPPT